MPGRQQHRRHCGSSRNASYRSECHLETPPNTVVAQHGAYDLVLKNNVMLIQTKPDHAGRKPPRRFCISLSMRAALSLPVILSLSLLLAGGCNGGGPLGEATHPTATPAIKAAKSSSPSTSRGSPEWSRHSPPPPSPASLRRIRTAAAPVRLDTSPSPNPARRKAPLPGSQHPTRRNIEPGSSPDPWSITPTAKPFAARRRYNTSTLRFGSSSLSVSA